MREERLRKVEFLTDQIRLFQIDLDRLKKTVEEIKILEEKLYGLPIA
jgi:hypothetical protein